MLLTSRQLADLVNYVLGLPVKLGSRRTLETAIHPFVVSTWDAKAQTRCEAWCLEVLLQAGAFPGEKKRGGMYCKAPRDLFRVLPGPVERTEQERHYRRRVG